MANVRGLYEDQSGQRWAWDGYDYRKVGRDFDPRSSSFAAGVSGAVQDIGAGVQQVIAGISGDDAALADLAQEVAQRRTEQSILGRNNPLAYLGGQMLPYAAGAGVGGVAGGLARGALGAWAGATAADVALGAASYGTPGERLANAGIAAGAGALGLGAGLGWRALRGPRPGTAAQRVTSAVEGRNLGAGGRATEYMDPQQVSLAARMAGRMLNVGRLDVDAGRLRETARARRLAAEYDVRLTPAMHTGSEGMEKIEAGLMSHPWSAAPGQRILNQFNERLEQVTKDFVLPGYEGPMDEDFFRALTDDINRKYQEIAAVSEAVDTETIRRRAQEITASVQDVSWTTEEHKLFNDLLNNVAKQGDQMQGGQAWNMQRGLAEKAASRFKPGQSATDYEMGTVYQSVADAIESALIDAASGKIDPADLNVLRKRYRVKMAIEKAGGVRGRKGLPMASTYSALQKQFPRELGEGRGFAQPELQSLNRMFDMWSIGNKLFRPVVGDSGTATRLSTADVSPRGIGANALRGLIASMYYNEPSMALRPALGTGAAIGAAGATGGAILD